MIYSSSEAIQLLALAVCFALALVRALRIRNTPCIEIACYFACMLLGNVYWYGYLAVFGDTPSASYISELSWIAGYVFLLMLLVECNQRRGLIAPVPVAWIPVGVCAACCVYYIYANGHPLLNLVDNGLVAALGFFAVRGLVITTRDAAESSGRSFTDNRFFYGAVLVFIIVEQVLWLSSLFDPTADLVVYAVINHLLTLSFFAILAAAWRSDEL